MVVRALQLERCRRRITCIIMSRVWAKDVANSHNGRKCNLSLLRFLPSNRAGMIMSDAPISRSAQLLRAVYAICLAGAALNHARDIWNGGWLPYSEAPPAMNFYWTALALLDPLAVMFLYWRPRAGLALTLLIIVSDVSVNSYAVYGLGYRDSYAMASLQLQSIFLGFVLGSFLYLWRSFE